MPNGIGFGGGGGAPSNIAYITAVPDATLTAEQALSLLSTGLLKNTGGTLSTAIGADLPSHNHAASEITSGTLALARGGLNADISGGGSTTSFLRQAADHSVSSGTIAAADIATALTTSTLPSHVHAASDITSGTLDVARIPSLPASQITSGQLGLARGGTNVDLSSSGGSGFVLKQAAGGVISSAALVAGDIPSLPASQLTSGQLLLARGGTGADLSASGGANQIVRQNSAGGVFTVSVLAAGDIPNLAASKITSGQLALAQGGTGVDLSAAGGANFVMKQAAGGVITSALILSADLTSALTTPPAIGGTTPSTGSFTPQLNITQQASNINDTNYGIRISTNAYNSTGKHIRLQDLSGTNWLEIGGLNGGLLRYNSNLGQRFQLNSADVFVLNGFYDSQWGMLNILNTATDHIPIVAKAVASQTVDMFQLRNSAGSSLFSVSKDGAASIAYQDTATNTVADSFFIEHTSSGTPAAGFGANAKFLLKSSTTTQRVAATIKALWNVATDATRAPDIVITATDANAEREIMRGRANGSAPLIGFLSAAPAIQQTGGAATATIAYTATEQDMLQKAYDALRTFGFLN